MVECSCSMRRWSYLSYRTGVSDILDMSRILGQKLKFRRRDIQQLGDTLLNRNPRNLDKLTIGYKPDGWHLEKPGRCYWHRLFLEETGKHVTAYVKHHTGIVPIQVSTKEWTIRKHLYSSNDRCAFVNLARVFAQRCLESGISEMWCGIEAQKGTNVAAFLDRVQQEGLTLSEPKRYIHPRPSDCEKPEKLWEIE